MAIDVVKLTNRYLDGSIRDWFEKHAPVMLNELDRIHKLNIGIEILQARMIDTYDTIMRSALAEDFNKLLNHFPELTVEKVRTISRVARMMVGPCEDPNNVFTCYNPQLLRFPMQLILMSEDKDMMVHALTEFGKRNPNFEYVAIGDLIYIEYVPEDYIHLLGKIPERNWEVRKRKGKDRV